MIKINYFDDRELLVRREIEKKAPKPKTPKCYPKITSIFPPVLFIKEIWVNKS